MFNGFYIIFQIPYIYIIAPYVFLILNVMSHHVGLPIIFLEKIMIWLGIKKNQKEFDLSLVKHRRIKVIDIIYIDQSLSTKEK